MNGRLVHRTVTLVLSATMVVVGLALLVQAIGGSGGSPVLRALLGLGFIAAGCGRTYVELRRSGSGSGA